MSVASSVSVQARMDRLVVHRINSPSSLIRCLVHVLLSLGLALEDALPVVWLLVHVRSSGRRLLSCSLILGKHALKLSKGLSTRVISPWTWLLRFL